MSDIAAADGSPPPNDNISRTYTMTCSSRHAPSSRAQNRGANPSLSETNESDARRCCRDTSRRRCSTSASRSTASARSSDARPSVHQVRSARRGSRATSVDGDTSAGRVASTGHGSRPRVKSERVGIQMRRQTSGTSSHIYVARVPRTTDPSIRRSWASEDDRRRTSQTRRGGSATGHGWTTWQRPSHGDRTHRQPRATGWRRS